MTEDSALQTYLLGTVALDDLLRLQRRLHYDVTGDPTQAALIVCEHPPMVTVGRQGSRSHMFWETGDLEQRGWPIRWVNRGGGCWLHLPGQLALYAILPLERLGLSIDGYLLRFADALARVLGDFSIHQKIETSERGVTVHGRLLAALGVSIREHTTYFGACFNLQPDLEMYRYLRCHPDVSETMTSLERERRGAVRPAMVRERLIEHFKEAFGFARLSLFSDHPLLPRSVRLQEVAAEPRL